MSDIDWKKVPKDYFIGGSSAEQEYVAAELYKRDQQIEQFTKELEEIAEAIHYPDCWDTMAYPTLLDAITEINHCSVCDTKQENK